jgi:uncharacterized protein YecT (DUF1311 family)
MRLSAFLIGFLIASTNTSLAQEPNCDNQQSQFEMNVCSGRDYDAADEKLNTTWKTVFAAMKQWDKEVWQDGTSAPSRADALLKSQRAWIDYRDGHCEAEAEGFHGGTILPLVRNTCLTDMTQKRTAELLSLTEGN